MSSSSSRQNSRFSTLKVFKFAGAQKPPPPPPKDPYYLPNHSLASLSQTPSLETFSPPFATTPSTPMSAGYASSTRCPSPSSSYTPSHAHSPAPVYDPTRTTQSPSTTSLTPDSASSRKGFFKFTSLGKRPKTPKSPPSAYTGELPPEPVEDPSISMPWNFQHNVHVDEAFAGLPPTWSASLTQMGFSDVEIAAIQARRNASKPTLHSIPRSVSPASSSYSSVTRPNPRTSSLLRRDTDTLSQRSDASFTPDISRSVSMSGDESVVSTTESTTSAFTVNRPLTRSPDAISATGRRSSPSPPPQAGPSTRPAIPPSKDSRPHTPTKRTYHVANDSIGTMASPPPAYRSPKKGTELDEVEDSFSLPPAVGTPLGDSLDAEEDDVLDIAPVPPPTLPSLPPRLSLHQDSISDLSSWTESLFSIIPGTPPRKASLELTPHATPSQPGLSSASRSNDAGPSASSSRLILSGTARRVPEPITVHGKRPSTPPSASLPAIPSSSASDNPLWQEVMGMVRTPDSGSPSPSPSASPLFPPNTPGATTSPATSVDTASDQDVLQVNYSRDKENRDSNVSTITVTPATIVRHVSIAKRARANMVQSPQRRSTRSSVASSIDMADRDDAASARSASPASSSSTSSAASSSAISLGKSGLRPDDDRKHPVTSPASSVLYVETSPQPSPRVGDFNHAEIINAVSVRDLRQREEVVDRPSIVIDGMHSPSVQDAGSPWTTSTASPSPSPITPASRYPGWVTEVVAPLKEFIDARADPRDLYADLQEIAEGESGSVYAARVVASASTFVAIKQVALVPAGSTKLEELQRELVLMRQVRHANILRMETLYVDVVEDALWIRMELMDRSLADILNLADEGVVLAEGHIAQFAADTLAALSYLNKLGIAHRDVRSDNLLVNQQGIVKLADFSSAIQVPKAAPMRFEAAGVIYWQAPEVRIGAHNVLKVDVWSLGATVWELAQGAPPFADVTDMSEIGDKLPPVDQPEHYSRHFHDFLKLCSEPVSSRPDPDDLLHTRFIQNLGDRSAVLELLAQCKIADGQMVQREAEEFTS